jgi:hypothetical protein
VDQDSVRSVIQIGEGINDQKNVFSACWLFSMVADASTAALKSFTKPWKEMYFTLPLEK